jgi:hypothetical protein
VQVPATQSWPWVQETPACPAEQSPEAPQWPRSVLGSTHWPLQLSSPCWQVRPHLAAEQTWPEMQVVPQVPQLALSVEVLAQ